jgi:hypothetical protein
MVLDDKTGNWTYASWIDNCVVYRDRYIELCSRSAQHRATPTYSAADTAAVSMAAISALLARRRPPTFGLKAGSPAFERT